ncbi:resolvase-like protein [Thermosporothrix hazakensis]|jgi:hypothetical protein|uniref:Resolvase-like protein n=1 Tax=Thermosporothrix hazakensis TaxID=644383 RepID=A0A326U240_THEHA|nr:recombinase family protein [Thermosporothrix hazakensis]PZW19224.1 resolvase-like protein [Thermosporothrix hazakensis]GCE45151.1 hypothetical protein KTH_00200 [Thermosporothrix hazakensis]
MGTPQQERLRRLKAAAARAEITEARQDKLRKILPRLDRSKLIVIYYRQSEIDRGHAYEESFEVQTIRRKEEFTGYGWSEENIKIVLTDANVPGTLTIADRLGLSEVVQDITQGRVAAVYAWMVDRLFRFPTLDEPEKFVQVCLESETPLITSTWVYDFATSDEDIEKFFLECQYADCLQESNSGYPSGEP